MGRKHRDKKLSDKEAEDNINSKLVETGYREELKKKVKIYFQISFYINTIHCEASNLQHLQKLYHIFCIHD